MCYHPMINSAVLIEYMTVKTSEHGIYRAIACAIHVRIAHAPSAPGGKKTLVVNIRVHGDASFSVHKRPLISTQYAQFNTPCKGRSEMANYTAYFRHTNEIKSEPVPSSLQCIRYHVTAQLLSYCSSIYNSLQTL